MSQNLRVERVISVSEWQSQNGPMQSWDLAVLDDDNGAKFQLQINSKPDRAYKPGDAFTASPTGKSYNGVPKYKREQPQPGAAAPAAGAAHGNGGPQSSGGQRSARPAVPFDRAVALLTHIAAALREAGDERPEHATCLFLGVLKGDIAAPAAISLEPPPPKASVTYFGKTIEVAGITQSQFDRVMQLRTLLDARFGNGNAKLLMKELFGVESSKDLDEAKAAKLIVEMEKAMEAPPLDNMDDGPPPF